MCSYISLITDCPDADQLRKVFVDFGRDSVPMANPSIQRLLVGRERQYCTSGKCDCGTVLGLDEREPAPDFTKAIQSKTKRGWSKAKIERWLAEQKKKELRPEDRLDSHDFWARIVREVLNIRGTTAAGLLVHYYEGLLDEEEFDASRREIVPSDDLVAAVKEMRVDELLVFRPRPHAR
jgi:hypothetical protein